MPCPYLPIEATKTTLSPMLQSLLPLSIVHFQRQSSRVIEGGGGEKVLYTLKNPISKQQTQK